MKRAAEVAMGERGTTSESPPAPRVVCLWMDAEGPPFMAAGSPHAYGSKRQWLFEALRRDLSVFRIEPAPRVTRQIPKEAQYPQPETCTPYLDATGLGFLLKPRLPLLFIR